MRTGDIILVRFPFTDFSDTKVRPAVVVCETPDVYKDIIVCMINSVIRQELNQFEILISPTLLNGLRSLSIIRVYRIATVDSSKLLTTISRLSQQELADFSTAFKKLI